MFRIVYLTLGKKRYEKRIYIYTSNDLIKIRGNFRNISTLVIVTNHHINIMHVYRIHLLIQKYIYIYVYIRL